LRERPVVYLTTGWEIYRDKLLVPEDFASDLFLPDEYVFIGQYGGFESKAGSGRGPHGSATYRLHVTLPLGTRSYTLELPEIYSAYRLYINGELMAGLGEPDKENYRAETGNAKLTLRTSGAMEIVVAVSDYSHYYSGMVYPPAFGYAGPVEKVLNTRFAVRAVAVALSLGVGLLYCGIWLLLRKDKERKDALPLHYAALCLCFALYICYPVVKTLWTFGSGWYAFENIAYPAMLLFVALIQNRVFGISDFTARMMTALGIFVCVWSFAVPLVLRSSLNLMMAHSFIMTVYTWIAAAYMLVSSVYGARKNAENARPLLVGAVVFGAALLMDRIFPLFEPIRFGWFSEISGACYVMMIGAIMANDVAGQFRLRLQLEGRVESVTRMMEVQKTYYPAILEKEEELREARHDFRHHMAVIRELADIGDLDKLKAYADSFDRRIGFAAGQAYCKHYVTDMLLRMYAGLAARQDTAFMVEAFLPETLPFDDVNICVILSNLLENALEASIRIPERDRRITVRLRCGMNRLGISVDNSFDGNLEPRGALFLSRKRSGREGVGIQSVRAVCARYGGSAMFGARENTLFHAEVLLPLSESEG